jgi:hypothetical protein
VPIFADRVPRGEREGSLRQYSRLYRQGKYYVSLWNFELCGRKLLCPILGSFSVFALRDQVKYRIVCDEELQSAIE